MKWSGLIWGTCLYGMFGLLVVFSLAGCVQAERVTTTVGDSRESANDIQRDATLRAVKDISIGAFGRETDPTKACAMALLGGFYSRLRPCDEWPVPQAPTNLPE